MLRSCLLSVLVAIGALLTCIGVILAAGAIFGEPTRASEVPPATPPAPAPPSCQVAYLRPPEPNFALYCEVGGRHLTEAIRVFGLLHHPNATDQYLAGSTLLNSTDRWKAEPLLRAAVEAKLVPWSGWPSVRALLSRVNEFKRLVPPLVASVRAGSSITLYAQQSPEQCAPVVRALGEFETIGRSLLGDDLPPSRAYLFSDRTSFESFHLALFGQPLTRKWAVGAANVEGALFCTADDEGRTHSEDDPDTLGGVLHELSHAWCTSYVMKRRGKLCEREPPWFVEGLAEYVASLREPAYLDRRTNALREAARQRVPSPSMRDMRFPASFYDRRDVQVRYHLSALLVDELVGPRAEAPATIRRLLDAIAAADPNEAERVIHAVTGKDPDVEFVKVRSRFW